MLNTAFCPLQWTQGWRTAMPLVNCNPHRPIPAARVRFLSVPSGYLIYKSPPRPQAWTPEEWLPKVEPMVAKSGGIGTWVTNRIEFVGPAIAADAIASIRRTILFTN